MIPFTVTVVESPCVRDSLRTSIPDFRPWVKESSLGLSPQMVDVLEFVQSIGIEGVYVLLLIFMSSDLTKLLIFL